MVNPWSPADGKRVLSIIQRYMPKCGLIMWTDPYTPARLLYRGTMLGLLLLLGTLPTLLCLNRFGHAIRVGERRLDEFMTNAWAGALCRIFGLRLRVSGAVQPPPVLLVSNHISWLDMMVLYSIVQAGFVSKAEIAKWPLIGFLARVAGTVFHHRGSHDSASSVTAAMTRRLNQGGRVAIFPEGGIRPGTGVKVFHARLFKAAVDADCPVQPVMIAYLRDGMLDPEITFREDESFMMNFLRLLGRPACRCEVRFLAPMAAGGRPRRELAAAAHAAVTTAWATVA